jgi:hypothetical protein
MIYTLVLVKLLACLAPDRAAKEQRFAGVFIPCLLMESINAQCNSIPNHCSDVLNTLNIEVFILFLIILHFKM